MDRNIEKKPELGWLGSPRLELCPEVSRGITPIVTLIMIDPMTIERDHIQVRRFS